ncbi:MAG: tetraether lipid synthase Tes [Thermoplasmata archaeon]
MVVQESKLKKGLPKETESVCPECGKVIKARIFEENGKVMIEKNCYQHGTFKDIYWSDAELYKKAEKWAFDGTGVENPAITNAKTCPDNCGLCNLHLSHTVLANLDLTNRCNLRCPICFANANAAGYVYEPSFEQVVQMMKVLRSQKPVPNTAIQFAGGEPTIYPKFIEVLQEAEKLGFSQIQVATNGVKFAQSYEYVKKCAIAGLDTVYLQFDGLEEEIYVKARGKPLLEVKQKAIENIRKLKDDKLKMSVVLVPTVVNGINDHQVGAILNYAIRNRDIIKAVNYQPVSFTGRINQEERMQGRFTLPDLVDRLVKQTHFLRKEDFYPVPVVAPISKFFYAVKDEPVVAFTSHPHCGLATYLFIENDGNAIPITRFIDVEKFFMELNRLADKALDAKILKKQRFLYSAYSLLGDCFDENHAPKGMDKMKFLKTLQGILSTKSKSKLAEFSWSMMMVGGMHFQDRYNYDIERVKRCVIHYVVPDGRIIPFCAYNSGPTYRTEVEKKYSIPLSEYKGGKDEE